MGVLILVLIMVTGLVTTAAYLLFIDRTDIMTRFGISTTGITIHFGRTTELIHILTTIDIIPTISFIVVSLPILLMKVQEAEE